MKLIHGDIYDATKRPGTQSYHEYVTRDEAALLSRVTLATVHTHMANCTWAYGRLPGGQPAHYSELARADDNLRMRGYRT